jgi:hypothetical protein
MVNYTTILNQTNASIGEYVLRPYTDTMSNWFFGILYIGTFGIMYMKTNDINLTAMIGVLLSSVVLGLTSDIFGQAQPLAILPQELVLSIYLVFTLSAGIVIYRVVGR